MKRVAYTIIISALLIWSIQFLYRAFGSTADYLSERSALKSGTASKEQRDSFCANRLSTTLYASTLCRPTPILDLTCSDELRSQFEAELAEVRESTRRSISKYAFFGGSGGEMLVGEKQADAVDQVSSLVADEFTEELVGTNLTVSEANGAIQKGMQYLLYRAVQPSDAQRIAIQLAAADKTMGREGDALTKDIGYALSGTRCMLLTLLMATGYEPAKANKLDGKALSDYILRHAGYLRETQGTPKSNSTSRLVFLKQLEIHKKPSLCRWPGSFDEVHQ